jgi:hypothetical protein
MRPAFLFYGGKWKAARHLGRPQREHVIEPFAGSAGFSCYWEPPMVTLVERDPVIYGVWSYLQRTSAEEILRLPANIDSVDELPPSVCQEARHLIGLWFNRAVAYPVPRRSRWARQPRYAAMFWGETIKLRIASQLPNIRHWKIIHGAWSDAPDIEAHWHIDPPYAQAGVHYRFNDIDRAALADWCRTRKGFLQVCEAQSANWLPFEPFMRNASHPRVRRFRHSAGEALFEAENA